MAVATENTIEKIQQNGGGQVIAHKHYLDL